MEGIAGRYGKVAKDTYAKVCIFQIIRKIDEEKYRICILKYGNLKANTRVNCTKAFIEDAEEIDEDDALFELI